MSSNPFAALASAGDEGEEDEGANRGFLTADERRERALAKAQAKRRRHREFVRAKEAERLRLEQQEAEEMERQYEAELRAEEEAEERRRLAEEERIRRGGKIKKRPGVRSQPAPKKSKRKPGAAARANQISSDRLVRVVENHLKSVNEISDLTTISNAINRELGLPWKRFSPKYGKLKTFLQSNKRAFRYVSDREIWRAAAWAEAKERREKAQREKEAKQRRREAEARAKAEAENARKGRRGRPCCCCCCGWRRCAVALGVLVPAVAVAVQFVGPEGERDWLRWIELAAGWTRTVLGRP